MQLNIERSVTVITPTVGSDKLIDAVESVKAQTYKNLIHLVVADGPEHLASTVVRAHLTVNDKIKVTSCPYNTGKDGFYGHRIYAAYPHLVNTDYVMFLDEDNWYDPEHVRSLVNTLERQNLDFAYSLRKISTSEKKFICYDDCESLGEWPIGMTDNQFLVDTSSYLFRRDFLIQCSHIWHNGWGADRTFFNAVRERSRHASSRQYTLNYRVDGNSGSVTPEFFIQGNKQTLARYEGKYPWQKT